MSDAFPGTVDISDILPALLDFERMPGRYRLALREPSLLFEQTHAVMLLAAGRQVKGMAPLGEGNEAEAAQKAARYFVRMVLLRAGSDHYTLLGLKPNFEPETLRDHYRLMIHLTHPDFSTPGEEWPADAASRINMANDVLASSVKRSIYDDSLKADKALASPLKSAVSSSPLARAVKPPNAMAGARAVVSPAGPRGHRQEASQGWSAETKMALAACGAAACVAGLWLLTPAGHEGLVVAHRADQSVTDPKALVSILEAPPETAAALIAGDIQAPANNQVSTPLSRSPAVAASALSADGNGDGDGQTASLSAKSYPQAVSAPPRLLLATPQNASNAEIAAKAALPEMPSQPPGSAQKQDQARPQTPSEWRAARDAALQEARLTRETASPQALAIEEKVLRTAPNLSPPARASIPHLASGNETDTGQTTLVMETALAMSRQMAPATPEKITPTLSLGLVQPVLGRLLASLKSGRGDSVPSALAGQWQSPQTAGAFVKRYQELLGDQRVTQVGKVSFRSRQAGNNLVVDGTVELSLRDSDNTDASESTKILTLIASFAQNDGSPMITQLVAAHLR